MRILWEIRLLGDLRVTDGDGGPNLAPFERKNAMVLLAYLACAAGKPQHREEIAFLLWPEANTPKGRQNLNGELSHLRAELNAGGIPAESALRADRDFVSLPAEAARIDVSEFETACARAERAVADEEERTNCLLRAFDAYGGPFLKYCDLLWASTQRERLADQYLGVVEQLRRLLSMNGDHERAIVCARKAIELHPDREELRLTLIRGLRDAGRVNEARSECRRWRDWLRAYGALEPGDEFLKLEKELSPPEPERGARPPDPPTFPPPLPAVFGDFVGREQEVERLCALLLAPENRLVTLHGPGGSGKTRLAAETANLLRKRVQVWFVGLSGLDDARRIPERLLRDLGADPGAVSRTADPLDAVASALEGDPTLLILDNFEHLASHGGVLVRDLLAKAPGVTCLITSRQTLNLNAERQFPVEPLPVPERESSEDEWIPERLAQNPSVALFLDRARRRSPDFALTYENADAVASLCRHLEGLPLALELAASWVRVLTPRQMLTSFRRILDLIPPEAGDQPEGHRSLEATLWVSYNLLPDDRLRTFFAQLSVFAGSWDDEATQAVACDDDGPVANHLTILTRLMHLCNASLLQSEEHRQGMRYRMLGLVRAFAGERLKEGGNASGIRERHRTFYRSCAEQAEHELEGWEQAECLDRWERDLGNLRLTLTDADPEMRLRLASGMHRFWEGRGLLQEGLAWLRDAGDPGTPVPGDARRTALRVAASLADTAGDIDEADALLAQGLSLATAEQERAPLFLQQASLHLQRQQHREARAASLAALKAARKHLAADSSDLGDYYSMRGYILKMQGYRRRARPYYECALHIAERYTDSRPAQAATSRNNLGLLYEAEGRLAEAREYVESALEINRKLLGERHPTIAVRRNNLGRLLRQEGDLLPEESGEDRRELWRQAREHHRAALAIYREFRPAAHLDIAMSRYYLGLTLHLLGEGEEVLDCFGQAVPVLERKFGSSHPFVQQARNVIGYP